MSEPFTLRSNIKEISKWFDDVQKKQLPFAISQALNQTAKDIKEAEIWEMKKVFDKPTPYTLNSLQITPSRKSRPVVSLWFKWDFGQKHYLVPQVEGGSREQKRSEHWLSNVGPAKSRISAYPFWVPASVGARINKYGNISPGQITQILAGLQASPDATQWTTRRSRQRKRRTARPIYVAITKENGGLHPGVYQRLGAGGRRLRPILLFVKSVHYAPIFDFYGVAWKTTFEKFNENFTKALDYALATAK